MDFEKLKLRIVGPCTSLITPFKADYSLDEEGLRENIRFILKSGYSEGRAVLLACTPGGESPSMTISERKRAMEVIAEEARGKIPLETSAHDSSQEAVIEMMRHAHDLGFDAVQLNPPWYYGTSNDEVVRFFEGVTRAVDMGVVAYNTTWLGLLGGVGMEAPLFKRLSRIKGIVGIKWSSPNWYTYNNVLRDWKQRFVFTDNDRHGLGCLWGCTSFLDNIAQYHPKYPLQKWEILKKGDAEKAIEHLNRYEFRFYAWMAKMNSQGINGEGPLVKLPMKLVGKPAGPAKQPYEARFKKGQIEELRQIMIEGGVPGVMTVKELLSSERGGR
ncbi:MAG: dihydrodipicolinate synthase family protein [Thaumarchaeota archaeon]|nr:dihydrodipicolinate synthase family protein [Nitrososphaerota archaeon]